MARAADDTRSPREVITMSRGFGIVSFIALILLRAATVAPAAAQSAPLQLDDFTWTFSGDPSGSGTVGADTLHIVGPAFDQCTTGDLFAWLTTTAPSAGKVSAHYFFDNQDLGFGWWVAEDPVFVVNGVMTVVGPGDIYSTWEGDISFEVEAGDSFGFGETSIDCMFGPGVLDVSAFSFTTTTWKDLGQGLAGIYGVPPLVGIGELEAGTSYMLSVVDALEFAPAWLVLGVAQLGAPFKGGVLVPDPAPPAALLLFNTGPNGRVILSGTWPAGVPAGTTLYLQYWFGDPAGPKGFSASNALSATTP
jgi:hypothetical protein